MIKFFRKIRKNLLSEGKTGKYIKYALGEIGLVMIGILLALQVNNWNENQKSLKSKTIYIERLIKDLRADSTLFSFYVKSVQNKVIDGKYIMSIINGNKEIANNKEFVIRLQNVGRVNIPKKANNTFLDLQSSGNLKLFRNNSLGNAIRNYYITDVDFWYSNYVERTTEGFLPIVTDILPFKMAEEIINSEMQEDLYRTPKPEYNKFNVSVSETDIELILEKLSTNDKFSFHLKNATRAHLLTTKIVKENLNEASALIETLKSSQE